MNSIMRTILFGGSKPESIAADVGLTLLRIFAGIAIAFHGWGKLPPPEFFISGVADMGFPAPTFFAWAAALSEFLGGLLLAAGFFTRVGAFFVFSTMMTAAFVAHWSDPLFATGEGASKEHALLFGSIALAFVLAGSGRMSVDAAIRR